MPTISVLVFLQLSWQQLGRSYQPWTCLIQMMFRLLNLSKYYANRVFAISLSGKPGKKRVIGEAMDIGGDRIVDDCHNRSEMWRDTRCVLNCKRDQTSSLPIFLNRSMNILFIPTKSWSFTMASILWWHHFPLEFETSSFKRQEFHSNEAVSNQERIKPNWETSRNSSIPKNVSVAIYSVIAMAEEIDFIKNVQFGNDFNVICFFNGKNHDCFT